MRSVHESSEEPSEFRITDGLRKYITNVMWESVYVQNCGGEEFRLNQLKTGSSPSHYIGRRNCASKSKTIQKGVSVL